MSNFQLNKTYFKTGKCSLFSSHRQIIKRKSACICDDSIHGNFAQMVKIYKNTWTAQTMFIFYLCTKQPPFLFIFFI